jgi:hypothetical protein
MSVILVEKGKFLDLANRMIRRTEVVLDVGPGICPQSFFRPRIHVCVEPFLPYIERARASVGHDLRYLFLNCTWDIALGVLPAQSVDSVFAIDVIEHFEKSEGARFLEEAGRVTRQQIVVFTPMGFFPQSYADPKKPDRWGMDGGYWQTHRSGWDPGDFDESWDLVCCESFHEVDQNEQRLERPIGAMWAFRNLDPKFGRLRSGTTKWAPTALRSRLRLAITRLGRRVRSCRSDGT